MDVSGSDQFFGGLLYDPKVSPYDSPEAIAEEIERLKNFTDCESQSAIQELMQWLVYAQAREISMVEAKHISMLREFSDLGLETSDYFADRLSLFLANTLKMDSNDLELLNDMTRVLRMPEATVIEVADIHWLGTHNPFAVWHPVCVLPCDAESSRIDALRIKLLDRKKFFLRCTECGLRNAKGHMDSAALCMGCAEKNHGVVY